MNIFVIIPALRERGNIKPLVQRLDSVFKKENITYKILFVLQGEDGSKKLLDSLHKRYKSVHYIAFPRALGIGKAYINGFKQIEKKYSHILTLDADLNHEPESIPRFLLSIKKHNLDLVIGSRFIKGGSFQETRRWKKLASNILNTAITQFYRIPVHDISSGFRLINTQVILNIVDNLKENGYPSYMEFMILAKKSGAKIGEVPITYVPRVWGKSKMGKLKTTIDYLLFLPKLPFIS